jgi:restriction system protein
VKPAYRQYVSVLEPQVSAHYALQPEHLKVILQPFAQPAIQALRGKITGATSDQPKLNGEFPVEPVHPGEAPPSATEPKWEDFAPNPRYSGWIDGLKDVLSGAAGRREREARARLNSAINTWKIEDRAQERAEQSYRERLQRYEEDIADYRRRRAALESDLRNEQQRFTSHARKFQEAQTLDTQSLNALFANAVSGANEGIEALAAHIVQAIPLPLHFTREVEARFDPIDGILLYSLVLPNIEEVGLHVQLKTKLRDATEKEIRAAQEYLVHALSLRLMHEVFATAELSNVEMIGVNMRLRYTNRHNGKRMDEIIGSLAATRSEFASINVAEVDPKLCFRSLKGVAAPSFQDLSPVRPVLTFDRSDKRIVESREVVDKLDVETNLAAMDWEDFEHVVRELFSKMFSARSEAAEVHVTRASRDYGVDALIHDPDPIHGGKFVIQAKRYVNTVEVAAVRDLFGTVQNEGANRGYLVTTSSFGPDAHSFAKGKPLTLIDGAHLLQLLKDHGYSFRINLQEARQMLHGR